MNWAELFRVMVIAEPEFSAKFTAPLPVTVKVEVSLRVTDPLGRFVLPPLNPQLRFAAEAVAPLVRTKSEETPPTPLPRPTENQVATFSVL